jgi:glycosyltransferase involved in cell wall biosynthesis
MNSSSPLVSVIIPAYNVTAYISEALDSVCAQNFRDFEIIVINDGCPDTANLERVLTPYQNRIRYLKQENRGLAGARNTGIRATTAPLIALLDADDLWEPEYLETHVKMLSERPEIDLVYPNAYIFAKERVPSRTILDTLPRWGDPIFRNLVLRECYVFVSVTARREAMIRAGLFDENFRVVEDFDLWLRMLLAGSRFATHTRPLAWYRRSRPDSLSQDPVRMTNGVLNVYQKLLSAPQLSAADREVLQEGIVRERSNLDFYLGKQALYHSKRKDALERLARANRSFRNPKISMALWALRLAPGLLYRYVHRRYPTERAFLNADPA